MTQLVNDLAATRRAVIEVVREMDRSGLTSGTAGNVSARVASGEIVVTPSAMAYPTMQPDDLVVCDPDGRILAGERAPTGELALHLACLRRHDDVHAVVHSHAVHASMFAVLGEPIPCVLEEFEYAVGGDVLVADYHRTGSPALGDGVAALLGDRAAALIANHGLVVVAATPAEALALSHLVERAARIIQGARAMGEPIPLPERVRREFAEEYRARRRAASKRFRSAQASSDSSAA